jgi:hypothetical protein
LLSRRRRRWRWVCCRLAATSRRLIRSGSGLTCTTASAASRSATGTTAPAGAILEDVANRIRTRGNPIQPVLLGLCLRQRRLARRHHDGRGRQARTRRPEEFTSIHTIPVFVVHGESLNPKYVRAPFAAYSDLEG